MTDLKNKKLGSQEIREFPGKEMETSNYCLVPSPVGKIPIV